MIFIYKLWILKIEKKVEDFKMKIIITEGQQKSLLHTILDDMFEGAVMKYEGDARNYYVDGNLMMQVFPNNAYVDKSILEKTKDSLFYDTMNDFKDEVKKWVISTVGVKNPSWFKISLKNLLGTPEPPKEKKKPVREKNPPKEKKTKEQRKKERDAWIEITKQIASDRAEIDKKYGINESKLDETIMNYFDEIFPWEEINWHHPYDYDEETGEEGDDENRIQFYIGDYDDGDNDCFRWYSCNYFNPGSPAQEICPTVTVEYSYTNTLNGYFGDKWEEPFKKWFTEKFDLPIKTVEWM